MKKEAWLIRVTCGLSFSQSRIGWEAVEVRKMMKTSNVWSMKRKVRVLCTLPITMELQMQTTISHLVQAADLIQRLAPSFRRLAVSKVV